ncbi:hypothetical protein [Mycobacterium kubicae]|uniref:hypothetical protein n=1 Tax=Mycobacterium kubicae TaxID=120959 RepID=UPI001041F7D7|nr:hypothetical protein [Mycobacterium kubicae]
MTIAIDDLLSIPITRKYPVPETPFSGIGSEKCAAASPGYSDIDQCCGWGGSASDPGSSALNEVIVWPLQPLPPLGPIADCSGHKVSARPEAARIAAPSSSA